MEYIKRLNSNKVLYKSECEKSKDTVERINNNLVTRLLDEIESLIEECNNEN